MKLSDTLRAILALIGGLGLSYGLYIYFNAIEYVEKLNGIPISVPLTIAMILVWLAIILTLNQSADLKAMDVKSWLNPIKLWGTMFQEAPTWALILAIASFLFGIVNMGLMMRDFAVTGIVKELTADEHIIQNSKVLKAFTAAHIFFLGIGTGIIYPRRKI
jgi:hypothetical protein